MVAVQDTTPETGGWHIMRRLLRMTLLMGVLGALAACSAASVAFAATDPVKDEEDSFVELIDCTGNLYNITVTYNGVSRDAANGKGQFLETGTFVATPVAGGQAASGRFTIGGTFHQNADGSFAGTFHFRLRGTYADGTSFSVQQQGQFKSASDGAELKNRFHDSCAA